MSQAAAKEPFCPTIPLSTSGPEFVEEPGPVGMLLKSPQTFARLVAQDKFGPWASLLLSVVAIGSYAAYGLAVGVFAGGSSLWMATLKVPLILAASIVLCTPSLYVFVCLSGAAINPRQVAALLSGVTCLSGLLLLSLAPVAWLFGVSTGNPQFMVLLHFAVWAIAIACGFRVLAISLPGGLGENRAVILWLGIFLVISAQMLTYFRPVLGAPAAGFRDHEKRFFFQHFIDSMAVSDRSVISNQ